MSQPSSTHWPDSGFGRWILTEEEPVLGDLVRRFHGDTLLWSGTSPRLADGVKRCMVRNRFYLAVADSPVHTELASLRASLAALPLPNKSVDGFVLHHSLELQEDPRQTLREVGRVVAPGGRLLICAFNGISLWGLRSLCGRLHEDVFSGMRFVNPLRLLDWLTLLGFQLEDRATYLGFGLPLYLGWRRPAQLSAWLRKVQPPTGGVLILSALKQVQSGRLIGRRNARRSPEIAPTAYPKPSTWKPLEHRR